MAELQIELDRERTLRGQADARIIELEHLVAVAQAKCAHLSESLEETTEALQCHIAQQS